MSTQTLNLGLIKPADNETADIAVINQNMDTIDAAIIAKLLEAKGYTDTKIAELVNAAPQALDTLKELADALGDDPNFRTTILNQLALKANATDLSTLQTTVNSHLADNVSHITATERTNWNGKVDLTYQLNLNRKIRMGGMY